MRYDFLEWWNGAKKSNLQFDINKMSALVRKNQLAQGCFYIFNHNPKDTVKKGAIYNQRPICLSLGESKTKPHHYKIIDLSYIQPEKLRADFINWYFTAYNKYIIENMLKYWDIKKVEQQKPIEKFTIKNFHTFLKYFPFLKKSISYIYTEDIRGLREVPFSQVYLLIGKECEKNFLTRKR